MKEKLLKAIEDLWTSYDAYYFINKYDDLEKNTHKEQFELLINQLEDDEMSMKAINWIKICYDSYYKNEFDDEQEDNAFNYLRNKIEEIWND